MAFGENQGIKILLDKASIAQSKSEFAKLLKEFQGEATKGVSVEFNDAKLKNAIEQSTMDVKQLIEQYKSLGDVQLTNKMFDKQTKELDSFKVKILDVDKVLTELSYKNTGGTFNLKDNGIKETDQSVKYAMEEAKIRQQSALENQKLIDDRVKKEQDYNDMWQKLLKNREIQEKASYENIIKEKEVKEQSYDNMWQKLLKNREIQEKASYEKLAVVKAESQKKLDAMSTNGILNQTYLNKGTNTIGNMNVSNSISSQAFIKEMTLAEKSIIRLQAEMNKYQKQYDGLKAKYGKLVPKAESEQFIQVMNKMQSEVVELKNGTYTMNATGLKSLGTEASKLNGQISNIAKNTGIKMATQDTIGFSSALQSAFNKAMMFAGIGSIMYGIANQFKSAIGYVNEMDKAMTNVQMITGRSKEEVVTLTDSYKRLAGEMSSTNAEMMKGSEEFLRAGYSDVETKEMLRQNLIASKISGQDQGVTSEQLIAIKNSYDMTADSISHVNDVLSTLDDTSATSYAELAKIMQYSAFSAKEVKVGFEELGTYASVVSSKTRLSAETIGTALKSIFTRYNSIKKGLKEDEEGGDISGVERVLGEQGIRIRSDIGTFREFGDVLQELRGKLDTLSEVDRSKIFGELGGTRQANILSALVTNLDAVEEAQNKVGESAGSSEEKFGMYQEHTEAKVNELKHALETMYDKMFNSEQINNVIVGLTSFTEAITKLDGRTVAMGISFLATMKMMSSALSTFKIVSAFSSATEATSLFQKIMYATMTPVTASTKAYTAGAVAVKTLSSSTTALGVKSAITANAIKPLSAGVKVLGVSTVTTTSGVGFLSAGFKVLGTAIWGSIKAIGAFMVTPIGAVLTSLGVVLAGVTLAWKKNAEANSEFKAKVDENKESVDALTESLKTMNLEGIDEASKPLQAKQDQYQEELKKRKEYIDEINALKLEKGLVDKPVSSNYLTGNSSKSTGTNYTSGSNNMDEDSKKIAELEARVSSSTKAIEEMNKEFSESGIIIDEVTGKVKNLEEANEATIIPRATKQYEDARVSLGEIEAELEKVNALQEITPDLASELLSKYPEIEGHLGSVASVQEFLNGKVKEQGDIQREAYSQMVGDDTDYYNTKLMNDNDWKESVRQNLIAMGASREQANAFDFSSFKNLNDMKTGILNQFGVGVGSWLTNFVGTSLSGYDIDLKNFKSAGEAKLAILSAIDNEIAKLNANMGNSAEMALVASNQKSLITGRGVAGKLADSVISEETKRIQEAKNQIQALEINRQRVNTYLGGFAGNFSGFTPSSIATSSPSGTSGTYTPDNSGSDKDSTAKKEAKAKEDVADIESKTDKYLNFNDALSRVNGELTRLSQLQEHANDKDKIKYMEDEIRVLDQKKKALEDIYNQQRLDSGELNTLLSRQGILNGDGTIDNDQLEYLRNIANASTGDEKKARQEIYTQAIENVKKYSQLRHKDMVDSLNDIADIGNQQISIQKKIADIIKADIEEAKDAKIKAINEEKEKQLKIINEELDARVKAINEAKEKQLKALSDIKNKYNKENELDDFNENMAKEQSALAELNASRMNALKDNSALGKAMLRDIDNQIKAKREEIAKLQLDQSRKEENAKLDEESEKVSEDNDSKIKEIEDGTAEAIKKLEATAEGMLKQLDIDAETLGTSLDRNLVEKFKSTNTEIDMMISKFKDIGLTDLPSLASMSMISDQGRAVMSNSRGISANTSGLEKSINNLVSSSNQSPITFSMPITVNGKPTDAEYKEIESKFGDILNKGIKAFEEKLYQRDLKYGLA